MELKDNPLLKPEDFLSGYRDSIEELKNKPELVSFEKLTYEVFSTDAGKKFMELIEQRYLIPSLVNREAANYTTLCVWADGFKDFARMLKQNIISHDQRIKAGMENDRRNK